MNDKSYETVLSKLQNGVRSITLNRPGPSRACATPANKTLVNL